MQRILTVEQMREADRFTIENLGVSEKDLVIRAGQAVADEIKKRFFGGRVLVCVGKGKNGADGRVVASELSKTHGYTVTVFDVARPVFELLDVKYDIIVDCIFGTGLNRKVEGDVAKVINKINTSKSYVISCDIPSGINGDNGQIMGVAVKADLTVAIQEYKCGHFLSDGIDYSGEVVAKDIGISIWGDDFIKSIGDNDAKQLFINRDRNVHKGCFGKVAVIGGSKSFSGAPILSLNALTALKSGTGYAYLGVPESIFNACVGLNPECILTAINDDGNAVTVDKDALNILMACDSIAIGMGMTVCKGVYELICYLLENYTGKLLIDADGLNSLSKFGIQVLKNKKCKVVLTPHIGEFSRLVGKDKQTLAFDIITPAMAFAKEYGVTLIVKSAVSIITDGNEVYFNTTGCSGMAKGGSGDVLSGFTAGVLARTDYLLEAVTVSAYVFGKAGEIAQKQGCEYTITASDIVNCLPKAIKSL